MLQIREECGSYSEKTEIDMSTDMSTEINMSTQRHEYEEQGNETTYFNFERTTRKRY